MSITKVEGFLVDIMKKLALSPYRFVYIRNTHDPIVEVLNTTDGANCQAKLEVFFKLKLREVQYVQVAGAVIFAATIASLSWPAVSNSHWSGPALWYAAILFSLASVILAGQQAWLLPLSISSPQSAEKYKQRIRARRRLALFAWQTPMMCLCYSIMLFLAGLTAVVVSPFARVETWGDEAKVMTLFLVAAAIAFCILFGTSEIVNRYLRFD